MGFAAGNGPNDVTPFIIPPWGADLEADVENINGSGRDHLLEIWYEHVFPIDDRNMLSLTLGIIDASLYLDNNAYANDEYVQFMHPALSNAPNTLLPSYDLGVAAVWRCTIRARCFPAKPRSQRVCVQSESNCDFLVWRLLTRKASASAGGSPLDKK